jgi:dTMP kinase
MDERGNETPGAFSLIRRGPFARLWWAGLASSFGDWVALFATIALADAIGGVTGILVPLTARMLPGLFGAVAGVLADRFTRKVTMVVCDIGRALLVVSLVFVHTLPQLFLISFLMEVLTLFWGPAREASVPNLVPPSVLVRANSLSLMAMYGTLPLGSAMFSILAGISELAHVLGAFGSNTGLAFLVDGFTFLTSAAIISRIPIPKPEVSARRKGYDGPDWKLPFKDIVEGIRFILHEHSVRSVIMGIATALFGAGVFFALGQPFSSNVLNAGSSGFGFLVTALGSGVGIGMIALSFLGGSDFRRDVVFGASLLETGLTITATAMSRTVAGAAFWALLAGIGAGSSYVMGFTHLHEQVTDELRGRTFAALYAVARTALLVSISLSAILAAALDGVLPGMFRSGIRSSLVLGGTVVAFAGAITLWNMRSRFGSLALTDKAMRSLDDASDAVSSIHRRQKEEE